MALYEQILGNIRDVIQSLNDEPKKDETDGVQASMQDILAFLDFIRLSKTVERYLFIIKCARLYILYFS